VPTRSSMSTPR